MLGVLGGEAKDGVRREIELQRGEVGWEAGVCVEGGFGKIIRADKGGRDGLVRAARDLVVFGAPSASKTRVRLFLNDYIFLAKPITSWRLRPYKGLSRLL